MEIYLYLSLSKFRTADLISKRTEEITAVFSWKALLISPRIVRTSIRNDNINQTSFSIAVLTFFFCPASFLCSAQGTISVLKLKFYIQLVNFVILSAINSCTFVHITKTENSCCRMDSQDKCVYSYANIVYIKRFFESIQKLLSRNQVVTDRQKKTLLHSSGVQKSFVITMKEIT